MMDEILPLAPGMFGLLSRPDAAARATAVVILNAGAIHRSGPFRLGTRLGRALASAGYATLRFDLPGVGDSLQSADRPLEQIVGGVLDRLQAATGCHRIVIGGICAAADLGWQIALADPRVGGVLMLDGLARKGAWFTLARWRRLLGKSPSAWLAALRRRALPTQTTSPRMPNPDDMRDWPARGDEPAQMRALIERGVEVLSIFSGSTSYFLDPRQFRATFGASADDRRVQLEYWTESDHTYFSALQRQRLINRVVGWTAERFPG